MSGHEQPHILCTAGLRMVLLEILRGNRFEIIEFQNFTIRKLRAEKMMKHQLRGAEIHFLAVILPILDGLGAIPLQLALPVLRRSEQLCHLRDDSAPMVHRKL